MCKCLKELKSILLPLASSRIICSDLSNNSTLIFHVVGMPIHQAYFFPKYVGNDLKMLLNYFLMEHLGLDLCKKQ